MRRAAIVVGVLAVLVLGLVLLRTDAPSVEVQADAGEAVGQHVDTPTSTTKRVATVAKAAVPLASEHVTIPKGMLACDPAAAGCGTCKSNADCGDDGYCGIDWATRAPACIRSNCRVDADCKKGERCASATMSEAGSTITTCQAIGHAKVGEGCGINDGDERCAEGLVCLRGLCGASCAGNQKCPAGYGCTMTYDGFVCDRLSCDDVKCEHGYSCREGMCYSTASVDCSKPNACKPGETCSQTGYGNRWEARCRTPCNADNPCEAGSECSPLTGTCLKTCRQGHEEDCTNGDKCMYLETMTNWACDAPSGMF